MKTFTKKLSLNTKILLMALIPFFIFTSIFIAYSSTPIFIEMSHSIHLSSVYQTFI